MIFLFPRWDMWVPRGYHPMCVSLAFSKVTCVRKTQPMKMFMKDLFPKTSGQMKLWSHRPRFPWNSRGFPFQKATFWGPRSCFRSRFRIWPENISPTDVGCFLHFLADVLMTFFSPVCVFYKKFPMFLDPQKIPSSSATFFTPKAQESRKTLFSPPPGYRQKWLFSVIYYNS